MMRILKWAVLAFAVLFIFSFAAAGIFVYQLTTKVVRQFETTAGVSVWSLKTQVEAAWNTPLQAHDNKITMLVLGTDQVSGRPTEEAGGNVLTDSIMLATVDLNTFTITQLSLPRDLWHDTYKTKINALYYYGGQKDPQHPTKFPQQVIEEITGIPVDYVYVLDLDTLAKVIDALGGIDVQIDRAFTDDMFPRPGVDVEKVHDPKLLYETVSFAVGTEHMNGERALTFIRSRHSKDPVEGTDEARIARQQKVVQAMLSKLMSPTALMSPQRLGSFYALYKTYFSSVIPFEQVIAVLRTVGEKVQANQGNMPQLRVRKVTLSIQENGKKGVLYHPLSTKPYGGQWVYIPVDPTWNAVRQEIKGLYEEK